MENFYDIKLPFLVGRTNKDKFHRGMLPVDGSSLKSHVKALCAIAKYFRREFRYDFIQYGESCAEDKDCEGYLFIDTPFFTFKTQVFGGCCFRYREYTDAPPSWVLQWVWLHPFERSKGRLQKVWSFFEKKYGEDFDVEPPISTAMRSFLEKNKSYDRHTRYLIKK